jgi:hypothetical protein
MVSWDPGKERDYSAFSLIERPFVQQGKAEVFTDNPGRLNFEAQYHVGDLYRLPLGTNWSEQVDMFIDYLDRINEENIFVTIDRTGVGNVVWDEWLARMNKRGGDRLYRFRHTPITFSGKEAVTESMRGYVVPVRDMVNTTRVLMQNGRLQIPDELPLKDLFVRELNNFKFKQDPKTAHDSYSAWREGDHDDLVYAVCMSCWAGEYFLYREETYDPPKPRRNYSAYFPAYRPNPYW